MNYNQMTAGRDLDRLIAEKIMGWATHRDWKGHLLYEAPGEGWTLIPEFSTDRSAARAVKEIMGGKISDHLTDPHHICVAALKAVPVATADASVEKTPEKKEKEGKKGGGE